MNWAWEQSLPPASKLVLMALADAADEEGYCYPRVRTIAVKCGVSERTVQRTLKTFESGNLLVVTPRFTGEGRQTSNGYRLHMSVDPDKLSPSAVNSRRGDAKGVTLPLTKPCQGEGDTAMPLHEPPLEPSIEAPLQPSESAQLFFPAALSQAESVSVSGLIAGIKRSDAQELLDELAYILERRAIIKTTPIQWFYGVVQRYHRGDFKPTGAIRVRARREQQRRENPGRVEVSAGRTTAPEHLRLELWEAATRWQRKGGPDNSMSDRAVSASLEDKGNC
ncbi:helix-turn-helix domain-containing protein [Paraburkholderia mimosarum]